MLHKDGRRDVYFGMSLIGQFEAGDVAMRNLLLVTAANDETVVLEDLARAFGVVSETVRLVRKAYKAGGLEAVVMRRPGNRGAWKVTPSLKAKVVGYFGEGLSQKEVWTKLKGGKGALSKGTLNKLHKEWKATQSVVAEAKAAEAPSQEELPLGPEKPQPVTAPEPVTAPQPVIAPQPPPASGAIEVKKQESDYAVRAPEGGIDGRALPASGPVSQRQVQFLGAWLLVALTARLGLHAAVATEGAKRGAEKATRLAVDAVTVALGIGEACVEGVRRLAHRSAAALLLSTRAPSPTWVREVLGAAAAKGRGFFIRAKLSGALIRGAAARTEELAVFYVDNHMRPYSGFRRLLYGWRMQAKRPMPGTTDCHVHDADGRPLYRVATMAHDSLGKLLLPIAALLRLALGEDQRILLAFDRAASYAEVMAELRDAVFEFVAYEKKHYRLLPKRLFRKKLSLDGQRLYWYERGANLGEGRGRVRRICVRLPDVQSSPDSMRISAQASRRPAATSAIGTSSKRFEHWSPKRRRDGWISWWRTVRTGAALRFPSSHGSPSVASKHRTCCTRGGLETERSCRSWTEPLGLKSNPRKNSLSIRLQTTRGLPSRKRMGHGP